MTTSPTAADALTRVAREEGGRILALLADRVHDLDLAEESLQDAYVRAAAAWTTGGVPDNPAAWLYTVARNSAIDRWRRAQSAQRRASASAPLLGLASAEDDDHRPIEEFTEVGDEQLRLMLLCCHPALARDVQVALTLRLVGGLTTAEIAAAYLVPEATIAQRIVRAKRKIRAARIPLVIPADLSERAETLATVLSLIFNEGYLARTADAGTLTRAQLADQAIRLTATAADALPGEPELGGLLALQLFHRSREAARVDADGVLVPLAEQDRANWNHGMIAKGHRVLALAMAQRQLGPWQVQALIAAEHASGAARWDRIVRLYDLLVRMAPSPVVALNRAVAVAESEGPVKGLAAIDSVPGLDTFHLRHAARGHLLGRLGRTAEARRAWERAAELTHNPSEVAFARSRLAQLDGNEPGGRRVAVPSSRIET